MPTLAAPVSAVCFERVKLVERRANLLFLNLLGGSGYHCRIRLEPVEGGNLAGQRAQGSDLNVTFFGDLFEARIAIFELSVFGAELVVVFDLASILV